MKMASKVPVHKRWIETRPADCVRIYVAGF